MKRSREPEEDPRSSPSAFASVAAAASDDLESLASEEAGHHRTKILDIETDDEAEDQGPGAAMTCLLHQEKLRFPSYDEYESHYNKAHLNRCLECGKNFPSSHLLNLHIEESHDSFVAVKRDRGEHTYSCFVEGCERKCATPGKRRRHLIDKHMYPVNFFFAVTRDGIDGRRSLLKEDGQRPRRRSSVSVKKESQRKSSLSGSGEARGADVKEAKGETTGEATGEAVNSTAAKLPSDRKEAASAPDVDMDDLTGAMSALNFVPPSIRFGRGGKVGFARR